MKKFRTMLAPLGALLAAPEPMAALCASAGAVLVIAGLALAWAPLAFIVGGLVLVAVARALLMTTGVSATSENDSHAS